jgi:hypothetical protein
MFSGRPQPSCDDASLRSPRLMRNCGPSEFVEEGQNPKRTGFIEARWPNTKLHRRPGLFELLQSAHDYHALGQFFFDREFSLLHRV